MSKTSEIPPPSQFALLGERRFAALFWVQSLGAFNDQVFKTGFITLLTFRLADEMGLNVSTHNLFTAALFIIPFALFAPTAGQISDGMDKGRMMRWVKAAEIMLMFFAAIAFHLQSLGLLYLLLFLMGAQSAVFAPIKYGVLPQYLRENELVGGNGLIQGATFLAILLGQIAGAKLVLTDAGVTLVSVAVISIAIIGFIASQFAPAAPPLGPAPKVDWVFPRAMWGVVSDGRKNRRAFAAILGIAWFWFTGAVFLALLPAFVKEGLHGDENVFILLLATFSIGVGVGAVLCARIFGTAPRVRMAAWGAGGIAICSALLWLAVRMYSDGIEREAALTGIGAFLGDGSAWLILVCFGLLAGCAGLYLTPLNVVLQLAAPPNARGRFVACSNTITALAMAISSAVAGVLVAAGASQVDVFALVGGSGVLAALWAWRWRAD